MFSVELIVIAPATCGAGRSLSGGALSNAAGLESGFNLESGFEFYLASGAEAETGAKAEAEAEAEARVMEGRGRGRFHNRTRYSSWKSWEALPVPVTCSLAPASIGAGGDGSCSLLQVERSISIEK